MQLDEPADLAPPMWSPDGTRLYSYRTQRAGRVPVPARASTRPALRRPSRCRRRGTSATATGNDFPDELENDMRRLTRFLVTLSMGASLLLASAPASLAGSVDPSTLQPPPPPGAKCHTAGNQVICDTVLNFDLENQPDFDLPCGTLYLTGTDYREGFRFYVDGLMVRRHVTGALNVTGSLSPSGDGPTIRLIARWNIWSVWPVPGGGDDDAIAIEKGPELEGDRPGAGVGLPHLRSVRRRTATTRACSPRSRTSRWTPCARRSTPDMIGLARRASTTTAQRHQAARRASHPGVLSRQAARWASRSAV